MDTLQEYLDITVLGYMLLGVAFGFGAGYIIGNIARLKPTDRIILGILISAVGTLVASFVLAEFIPPDSMSFLIAVFSSVAGCIFGEVIHWAPAPPKPPKRHVVFDPEEDDKAFDREIEEAFGGSQ